MPSKQTLESEQTQTTWDADSAHTQAEFTIRHMMITNVRGSIPVKRATIVRNERDVTRSRVEVELDVAGLDTRSADRDNHLRSADFFDAQNHPTMRFVSTRVERSDDGLRVHGDLTIRGVTKPVALDVQLEGEAVDPWGKHRAGVTATTTIERKDWGLNWNVAVEAGGVLVGDKVKIAIHASFVRRD